MAQIPQGLESPNLVGLKKIYDGKVRGTYTGLNGKKEEGPLFLLRASNRISIFDFILNALIEPKGEILTAFSIFFFTQVLKDFPSHLVAYGQGINPYLPKKLQGDVDLMKRALVIRKLELAPVEAIIRFFLTGSGWRNFQKTGQCYGHIVPGDAWDGMELAYPLFTPTEKSDTDPWIHHDEVAKRHGAVIERRALQIGMVARAFLQSKGLDLLDFKLEMTEDGVIGDEPPTPDSSRIVDLATRIAMSKQHKLAPSLDKEYTRSWGKIKGMHQMDALSPVDIAKVQSWGLPDDVAKMTAAIYRYIFWRVSDMKLERFQEEVMGISDARPPKVKIAVVIGSKTDLEQCQLGLAHLKAYQQEGTAEVELNVISCHRNPEKLQAFAELSDADIFIAGAGWAAALPGILKAQLRKAGKEKPVIGVAFSNDDPLKTLAAQLSITELPGSPVILDKDGQAFTGPNGFFKACDRAFNGEFLPQKLQVAKPAEFNLQF